MRILQLTKSFPFPLRDGASWASLNMAKGLRKAGCAVSLASLISDKYPVGEEEQQRLQAEDIYSNIHVLPVSIKPKIPGAVINFFSRQSYHVSRYNQKRITRFLADTLLTSEVNVLLVERMFLMSHAATIKKFNPSISIVLRTHNVEHLIWERYARGLKGLRASYFADQSRRIKMFESEMINKADLVLSVSEKDKQMIIDRLSPVVPVKSIPIAMNPRPKRTPLDEERPVIFGFLGSLDWRPNVEGIEWFVDKVWSELVDQGHSIVLMIAGRSSGRFGGNLKVPNITFIGEIEDSDNFLQRIDVLVAPLFSGSGVRVKILQAYANSTPVISSSLAAEGIDVLDEKEIVLADDIKDWIRCCKEMISNYEFRCAIGIGGHEYLAAHHSIENLGISVCQELRTILDQK